MLGVKFTVALRARAVLNERWLPAGMACRGWPTGCMLGDGARDSASFDPQQAGAPFCFDGVTSYMHKVYYAKITFQCSFGTA